MGVSFPKQKRYEDVQINIISVTNTMGVDGWGIKCSQKNVT